MTKEDKVLTKKFIAFLQTKYPLRNDLKINFLGVRDSEMSTGSRTMDSTLKILSKGRLNRDILRTLAHEWVHEFARQRNIKLKGFNTISQENFENSESGIMIRMYEKSNQQLTALLYN